MAQPNVPVSKTGLQYFIGAIVSELQHSMEHISLNTILVFSVENRGQATWSVHHYPGGDNETI
jgi:hypothetical protein